MRITLAQINTRIGYFCGNGRMIAERIEQARSIAADIVVFPELAITGYPPEDLMRLVDLNECKRRQSPPGVKITPRAFGKDWRLPITKVLDRCARERASAD
jgi:Carbon-nitrogen hydrolase